MKTSRFSFAAAVFWLLLTTFLLVIPGTRFPKENWFDKIWLDKWVHIGLFSIMTWLWCYAGRNWQREKQKTRQLFIFFALLWFAYGIGMEFVQKYFIPFRSFDAGDIAADGIGCLFGYLFSARTYIKK